MKKTSSLFAVPYFLWIVLFVMAPVALLLYQSFFDIEGRLTLANYETFFSSWTYLRMGLNSILYAGIVTLVTFLISYPTALLLTRLKAQAAVVNAYYFTNLGQSAPQGLCFYGDFWAAGWYQ